MGPARVRSSRTVPRKSAHTIGLVVEGPTEYSALPLLHKRGLVRGCPPLKPSSLNGVGEDRTAEAIAKLVLPKVVAHQIAGRSPVIVCFDRERRSTPAADLSTSIAAELTRLLTLRGRSSATVVVVVADRAFEAWLLADAAGLARRRVFRGEPPFFCFEGERGERDRMGVVELSNLIGREYRKTRDGPKVFAAVDFAQARQHGRGRRGSASLDAFLNALGI